MPKVLMVGIELSNRTINMKEIFDHLTDELGKTYETVDIKTAQREIEEALKNSKENEKFQSLTKYFDV